MAVLSKQGAQDAVGAQAKLEEDCIYCQESSRPRKKGSITRRGAWMLGAFGAVFVGVYAATVPFVAPALRRVCLPFVPATTVQVENVLTALRGRGGSLLDIGSGDGRIVVAAARQGFRASGVELNPWLVYYSRYQAWKQGQGGRTSFFRKDLWKTDLAAYDNIVVFGVEQMMAPLESKLSGELKPGSRVVACRFPLPNWEPAVTIGVCLSTALFHINVK